MSPSAESVPKTGAWSPLWPLMLVLAAVAERVCRRQEEEEQPGEEVIDRDVAE